MVRFDPADGSKPTQSTVKTGTLVSPPQQNPQRPGFRFNGWTYDSQPFDLQTPILQDTTLKAKWSKTTDWTLSPDHGPATGARLAISPPNRQKPYYVSVQAAGQQLVGLTGDGYIYTWTKDSTPKRVPSPAQAPDGFHYLQAAADSQLHAALGSDQHIYTWTTGQAMPAILRTGRDGGYTSISMNDDRLLAVERQGQVHAYQASDADNQNQNPKLIQQATTSLPGKAQAVTAVASGSRILIVDADGQAWTWDTANTGNAKPARIKQDPGTRTVQAQALNPGFLLMDTDGQAWYLPDSTTAMTQLNLQDGVQASRITANQGQAVITGTDGRLWAWKPGSKPTQADEGNQQYMQAAKVGNRITAIDRQGSMFTWSPDHQGNPGKPARLDTGTAPTLESASMDGQPLKLTRSNDSWQADIPARNPGPAAILITGRQDGQPFTRSLNYTVDQPLTRDIEPRATLTVHFDTGGGSPEPADQNFTTPYGRVKRPSPDPTRQGFLFDGWFTGQVAYDFSRPVTNNMTLTAKWTPASRNNTWSISPSQGSQAGGDPTTITPPDSASRGIRFSQVSGSLDSSFSLAVDSDGNAYAWGSNYYGQLGDGTTDKRTTPVMVSKPANTPPDFTYIQVSTGSTHSLALGSDGNAYAWGDNTYGKLGDGTTTQRKTPVRVSKPANTPPDFTYIQVSAGGNHSLALGSDGNAYAWGYNNSGQLGDGTYNNRKTPNIVGKPADFAYVLVSAGGSHTLALGSDGNAYAWGSNYYGQLGDGTTTKQNTPVRVRIPVGAPTDFAYVQVSAGGNHSLAVGSDGYAYAWGWNGNDGQLGNNSTTDSAVPVRVRDPASPTDTNKGLKVVQVHAAGDHSLAVGSDGYAYAWGCNLAGQLGNKTSGNYVNPVPVRVRDPASPTDASKGLKVVQVSGGYHYSLAMGSDGNAYAWGYNYYGQLGNNNTIDTNVPVPPVFNLQLAITGVRFDQTPVSELKPGVGGSVTVTTPAHMPGTVTVSVDYTIGGAAQQPDTSLKYTYLAAGVLPKAGGEGILLALATGMTGMGGVLASRRHQRETRLLSHTTHE